MTMQMSVFMEMSMQCLHEWVSVQRQMSKIINEKYICDSACHVKPVNEVSCHVLVSPLCLERVAAYFTSLAILVF